jgi:hypothetical protein
VHERLNSYLKLLTNLEKEKNGKRRMNETLADSREPESELKNERMNEIKNNIAQKLKKRMLTEEPE